MRFILKKHYAIATVLLFLGVLFPYDSVAKATVDASPVSYAIQQINRFDTTIEYIHEMRENDFSQVLIANDILQVEAERRAQYIAETGLFSHYDIDGSTFYQRLLSNNSAPGVACENLSMQFSDNPVTAFNGWKKSPEHLACMSDKRMSDYGIATVSIKDHKGEIIKYVSVLILGGTNE